MKKKLFTIMSVGVMLLCSILSPYLRPGNIAVAYAASSEATDDAIPEKPSDDQLKPGQHWELVTTTTGKKFWLAIPVEPDPEPLGSVIVKTYQRKDGTVYGVDKHGYYGKSEIAESLSTTKTPTLVEFSWFLNGVQTAGLPATAESIHHPEDAIGDWKCLVIDDPDNSDGKRAYHLASLHMDCRKNDGVEGLSPQIEWRRKLNANMENETDESSRNNFLGIGNFTDGWCGKDDNGNISFQMWTMDDGKQYALGSATINGSDDVCVVLVR